MKKNYEQYISEILENNKKFENYEIKGLTGGDEDKPLSWRKISYTCGLCGDEVIRNISIDNAKRGQGCSRCKAREKSLEFSRGFQHYADRINEIHPHIQCVRWLDDGVRPSKRRIQYHCTHCSELRSSITNSLLQGYGCKCNQGGCGGYNATTVARNPDKPISLYYIRFDKPGHPSYYKIGLDSTGNRWSSSFKGWGVTEIWREEGVLKDLFAKEQAILEEFKEFKGFHEDFRGNGHTETFNKDILTY